MCGNGEHGQLGTGHLDALNVPTLVHVMDSLQSVACGMFHTLAVGDFGSLWATGWNAQGQLGLGHKRSMSIFQKLDLGSVTLVAAS